MRAEKNPTHINLALPYYLVGHLDPCFKTLEKLILYNPIEHINFDFKKGPFKKMSEQF